MNAVTIRSFLGLILRYLMVVRRIIIKKIMAPVSGSRKVKILGTIVSIKRQMKGF